MSMPAEQHPSRGSGEPDLSWVANRLIALTDDFEQFVARQCERLADRTTDPGGTGGEPATVEQLQLQRELLTQAWKQLETERRKLMLSRGEPASVASGPATATPGPELTAAAVRAGMEVPPTAESIRGIPARTLRQVMDRQIR
jgi:hypothetical protein